MVLFELMSGGELPKRDSAQRYRALLLVTDAILQHKDLAGLFHELGTRLHGIVNFDSLLLLLPGQHGDTIRLHVLESSLPSTVPLGYELPIENTPAQLVLKTKRPYAITNTQSDSAFPEANDLAYRNGVRSYVVLPLATAQTEVGAVVFGSSKLAAYGDEDLEFLEHVAAQVAVAVDNVLSHEIAQSYLEQLKRERDHSHLLLETSNALLSQLDLRELFVTMSHRYREVSPDHDFAAVTLLDPDGVNLRLYALDFPGSKGLIRNEESFASEGSPAGWVCEHKEPLVLNPLKEAIDRFPSEVTQKLIDEGLQSMVWVPLRTRNRVLGTLSVGVRSNRKFTDQDIDHILQTSHQAAIALENAFAFREIAELRDKLTEEKLYLEDEIRTEFNFDEIVGESPALKRILKQVEIVAPTDSTVLILGETGTGKELIARAIHKLSQRSYRTFVKMNCPAIPAGLLESELFGHERGAFTGAIAQKIGRVELANRGTLFLDEVGDLPLDLQPKLLRLLQERDFERIGGTKTLKADVRVIAATNRDLEQMVSEGTFRSDLYYRLYVFPITAPPLRDRPEDIPNLVRYFVQKYSRRMNKNIETITSDAMHTLSRLEWHGNIRELENFIERAVILTAGKTLHVPVEEFSSKTASPRRLPSPQSSSDALDDAERKHIIRVLRETDGVIAGPQGAAARLGLKRTTLQSKMKKLGITRTQAD